MAEPTTHHSAHGDEHGLSHVMPIKVLFGVWGLLMVLTVVTVLAATLDLGAFDIWVAMGIATVKALAVALYFMHLRYDRPFHRTILVASLLFVLLFIALTWIDTDASRPGVEAWRQQNASRR